MYNDIVCLSTMLEISKSFLMKMQKECVVNKFKRDFVEMNDKS